LGNQIRDETIIGSALTKTVVTHFDPKTNHCYVDLTVDTADLTAAVRHFTQSLYDGQTKELLAFSSLQKDIKNGSVFVRTDITAETPFDQANDFMNKLMEDDRTPRQ
jgi:hypothetical protein